MDNSYPFLSRNLPLERTAIYFDTEAPAFNAIQEDLARTIVLWGSRLHLHGNIVGMQLELAVRYGGDIFDYPFTQWENNMFLIRLPSQLNRTLLLLDINQWCLGRDILVVEWNPNAFLHRQPFFSYRLDIVVTGFPLPLWHEFFIIRLLSTLGDIIFVDDNNLSGRNKSCIAATIRCVDPRAISRFINVHFLRFWSECRVHIKNWNDIPYIPARVRPFPEFGNPDNPYGDDPNEEDNSSPIRAHAISCHDSLREVFQGVSPQNRQTGISLPAVPQLGMNFVQKASVIIGDCFVFPEAVLFLLRACMAILIFLVQSRLGKPPTKQSSPVMMHASSPLHAQGHVSFTEIVSPLVS